MISATKGLSLSDEHFRSLPAIRRLYEAEQNGLVADLRDLQ
ncbi:hypothetical protein ACFLSJ_06315 [Verrucomicrobiota bacterium]